MSKISSLFKYSIKHNNKNTYSGFSLIELSIVLIIIGILIIGAIRGYALITASRIITLTNELTQYAFAAEQFSVKYGNLPGIIDNPQKILGPTAKSKIDDNKIDTLAINESASITNAESINFFNHLYLSGLLGESSVPFVGTNEDLNSKSEITKDSNYYPTLRSLKSMFIYVRGDDINGNYNKLNRLTVSNYSNSILGINADLVFGLDNKVDDGLPLSGLISIVPMKISNYGSDDKSSSYNNRNNNINTVYTNNTINNIIDYYLMSSKTISTFNIINTANANDTNNTTQISCLILDKSTNEIRYNTKGKNCFILRNIDSTQQNKITDLGMNGATGESCNLLNKDNYPNAESVAGTTMLNGSKKTIKCNDGYTGNITITCNEGHQIHSGDTQCTFTGCKKYDNNITNNSLNAILTTNDIVNWDDINEEDKDNLSNDDGASYNKNDVIATLNCKEKEGYKLKEGSNGYTIKCDGNDAIVVDDNGGCEYEVLTCSISDLTTNILGNEFVKTISWCTDLDCNTILENSIVDITLDSNKGKIYDFGTIITVNTCSTGYSILNKRMMRCNENGQWEIHRNTENNMCVFTGCNDMSAVFDINERMISSQLYKTTFAYNDLKSIFPILSCKNTNSTDEAKNLSSSKDFVADTNTLITCGEDIGSATNGAYGDMDHRKFICTKDTTNINGGKSYWKYNYTSCDLNEIKDKSYTVWLAKDSVQSIYSVSTSNATTLDTNTFQKRYMANIWGNNNGIATSEYNNFTLTCNANGNWRMNKTVNSCSGAPILITGSKLYENDNNILYVENQPGMLMNTSMLSKDTSTLTKTMLINTSQYFLTNGTKIEASCDSGYQEVDQYGLPNTDSNAEVGGHYYECVKGSWTAMGGCKINTCSIEDLTPELLGNEFVKTIVQCNDEMCSNVNGDEIIDITTEEGKSKTYDYNTYITINTCSTGYSIPENKRMLRCSENGQWEIHRNTENNMCVFTGCNDMSAVFDKNNNKVSEQLYDMTFGSGNTSTKVYPLLYCHNNTLNDSSITKLNENSNFVVNSNNTVTCGDNENVALDITNENRHYVCTTDLTNINNGNSYWKTKTVSCDLNTIRNLSNKGYTAYLSTTNISTLISVKDKSTQYRYLNSSNWSLLYTNKTDNFNIQCDSTGNWVITKTTNSCSGTPELVTGSKLYENDNNILYVENQPGMLMNTSILSNDTSTLTTAILSNTSQYFVTNGTKIEASCNIGFQEVDRNNLVIGQDGYESGGHYYECVDGTWTARGGCVVMLQLNYYSPRLYDDVNKTGSIAASKYVNLNDSITCSTDFFGVSDPDKGTLKVCSINGYRVAAENETFTVIAPNKHTFCHKSYIPRDLGVGLNGSAGVDGWCDDWITNDTYKGSGANVSNGSSFVTGHNDTNVSASTTLVCNNGTWEIGGGSMSFDYTGSTKTFCAPYGLKDAGKSITFELWGAQGGTSYGGLGGYTKGIMSNSYSDGDKYYVVVGSAGSTKNCSVHNSIMGTSNLVSGYGGKATYVSLVNNYTLSNISIDNILLVAGGGGGGFEGSMLLSYSSASGGAGGGGNSNGNRGSTGNDGDYGRGGTLTAGGSGYEQYSNISSMNGGFGYGGNCDGTGLCSCTGGGSGYYGGGASGGGDAAGGAGGGSGYCDTELFKCSGSNGKRSGNGYVIISW